MSPATRTLHVSAPSRSYEVVIGAGALAAAHEPIRLAAPRAGRSLLVVDAALASGPVPIDIAASLARAGIAPASASPVTIDPSETRKSLATVERLVAAMAEARLDRGDLVVALGGGIVGDVTGFAAASYRRGIAWINCPTTLLAMVDASVGGKTGVNLVTSSGLKKNMVGAFWQPSLVVADVRTLSTLPNRIYRCGLAECVKHGLLAADWNDGALGEWTIANQSAILAQDPTTLTELIARNVAVKARVIGADEREEASDDAGGRALLNLGHTFAHAIEPLAQLSPDDNPAHAPLQHGEAVALGLVAASACSAALSLAPATLVDHTRDTLAAFGLPTTLRGLPSADSLIAFMQHDKKVAGGKLRLVLPCGEGRSKVVVDSHAAAVAAGWAAIRA